MTITAFLSRSLGLLNWGPGGPASLGHGPHSSIFSQTNSNFLCTELYYCFTTTQFNLSTVKVIPLIPSTGFTCNLHRCISYFDSSAGVNRQQTRPGTVPRSLGPLANSQLINLYFSGELKKMWNMKATGISVVDWRAWHRPQKLWKLEELGVSGKFEGIRTTAFVRSVWIDRKFWNPLRRLSAT